MSEWSTDPEIVAERLAIRDRALIAVDRDPRYVGTILERAVLENA